MKTFAQLYEALDATTSTNAKVEAMAAYFQVARPEDAVWALFFLTGRRLKRLLPNRSLDSWTVALTGLPHWLIGECYDAVGDFAETISLLVESGTAAPTPELPLAEWIVRLQSLPELDEAAQFQQVSRWWRELPRRELFLLNKLVTGELRVGVSDTLVVRALAQATGLPAASLSHRLMGSWEADGAFFRQLISPDTTPDELSRPYPFCLASPLDRPLEALGAPEEWQVEWKWDGIRGQLLHRSQEIFLWSRGEELITPRFPEVVAAARGLPDGTVLDGEVLAYENDSPLPFSRLQRRIGRQKLSPQVLAEAPVVFMAYDLLEEAGEDLRALPLSQRRARLQRLVEGGAPQLRLSPVVPPGPWAQLEPLRAGSRERNVEGFILKRLDSPYGTGRKKGDWWKWKVDPFSIDAVLVYAQPGSGRRASLFTDYTFAVWSGEELLPIAKAYSGLSDVEIAELDRWVRAHTRERFGPVRAVEPVQVFELHFEALARSSRHKSGIALRFPRISRWRTDKPAAEADTLANLELLLDRYGAADAP